MTIDTKALIDVMKQEIVEQLQGAGQDANDLASATAAFLASISGEITQALISGDSFSLAILHDRTAMALGRRTLGVLHEERARVSAIVSTATSMAIKLAIGALVAV